MVETRERGNSLIAKLEEPRVRVIRRVDISPGSVSILLDRNAFAACLSMGPERIREDALRILAPFRLRRRGVETKLVLGNPTKSVDRTLLRNIANALSWLDRIKAGKTYEQIATETPSQRTACARQSAMPSWLPTSSAPLSKAASPLG